MSYKYGNTTFATPMQASRAAVAAFLYGDSNNAEAVGAMNIAECTAELNAAIEHGDWSVPYLMEHTYTVDELVREVIMTALESSTFSDE